MGKFQINVKIIKSFRISKCLIYINIINRFIVLENKPSFIKAIYANMAAVEILDKINKLREEIKYRQLSTNKLLRLIPYFRLDWGNGEGNFSEEYNMGVTKPILLSGLADKNHIYKSHSSLFEHSTIGRELIETFITGNILTLQSLLTIHKLIIRGGGKIRKGNVVSNDIHEQINSPYSKPETIQNDLENLIQSYNSALINNDSHPLLLGVYLHYYIVQIHPFTDGNGRLARILLSMTLLRFSIPPPKVSSSDRYEYLSCLRNADNNNFDPLIEFIGQKVIDSMNFVLDINRNANA